MKRAFTLIELVLIVVVVGILAAVAVPQTNRNSLVEASDQLVSHIRYTQQLAMYDDQFDAAESTWFKQMWRIQFHGCDSNKECKYTIYEDLGTKSGNPNSLGEIAHDPQNPSRYLTAGFAAQTFNLDGAAMNKKLDLQRSYDINKITFAGGCANVKTVSFDNMGRPMRQLNNSKTLYDRVFNADCNITLENGAKEKSVITIRKETGYVSYQLTETDSKAQ